jgi:PEP-utilising enzyme, PEP-binding domain
MGLWGGSGYAAGAARGPVRLRGGGNRGRAAPHELRRAGRLPDVRRCPRDLYKADGIGLYRTEFGYFVRGSFPTEDEQFEFLERAAERFNPRRVVFRLLDTRSSFVGGIKHAPMHWRMAGGRGAGATPGV